VTFSVVGKLDINYPNHEQAKTITIHIPQTTILLTYHTSHFLHNHGGQQTTTNKDKQNTPGGGGGKGTGWETN